MTSGQAKRVRTSARGRPEVTTHGDIEQAAFALFAEHGFARTTLDAIAEAVGVSRRTLFRYYQSKNDIPWGQFDNTLENFRRLLETMPSELPLWECVHRGVVAFNDFGDDAQPPHRERMRLILTTPALQAHSALRYAEWRAVIAEYVASRTGGATTDLLPTVVAHTSLAVALTAYDLWLSDTDTSLQQLLDDGMRALRTHLDVG